jgi:hypothetical protein
VNNIAFLVDDSAGIYNKDVKRCAIVVKWNEFGSFIA